MRCFGRTVDVGALLQRDTGDYTADLLRAAWGSGRTAGPRQAVLDVGASLLPVVQINLFKVLIL